MRSLPAVLLAALLTPVCLPAQQRSDAVVSNPVMASFKGMSAHFSGLLRSAFDSIPAGAYSFHPTAPQQSIGYIAQHLVEANYALCERLGPMQRLASVRTTASDSVQARWPKDTLVSRLKDSFLFCDAAMAQLTDEHLGRRVTYGPVGTGATARPARSLLLFVTDLAEHYSQLSGYMRQLGLVPPSALPPRARTAVTLSPPVLSRYVGVYNLPENDANDLPAFTLDVTLKSDVLYVTPATRTPRRLWAESPRDFFIREVDAQVTFVTNPSGQVTGLVLHQEGVDRLAARMK